MLNTTTPTESRFLSKRIIAGMTMASLILLVIMLFSLTMHLVNLDSLGDANAYYTAAVKSMLKSWHNFFFAAAEPGGSVSVDKPPLGLWIEAAFAYFLGVSGFSVSLPNILAGVFGLPLLYLMVKKYMGPLAGLIAALVMAITPVFLATNRNNTMDGLLVFFLLIAGWAFIQATETSKLRWLLLGAFILGLGFNIKMWQAFLPLPAFYALYFLGSTEAWLNKTAKLVLATVLLAAVSLSWAIAVDLTPAEERPYIGSSGDNTVMGLILGHNGTSRLFNPRDQKPAAQNPGPDGAQFIGPDGQSVPQGPRSALPEGQFPQQGFDAGSPGGQLPPNAIRPPFPDGQNAQAGPQMPGGQTGTPFSNETGTPGVFRFFTSPLSKQMSWLLPFALVSLGIGIFASRIKLPFETGIHKALVLWGGWLLTCLVFLSAISGIFHSYYAIMLAPPLGALVGIGFVLLWDRKEHGIWPLILLGSAALLTIGFQAFASIQYGDVTGWLYVAGFALLAGVVMLVPRLTRSVGYALILLAMLFVPFYWTLMTVVSNSDVNLPTAYQGLLDTVPNGDDRFRNAALPANGQRGPQVDEALVAYLAANTENVKYLAAVPSAQFGARMVLATGRPVLYMGGFGGQDQVVSVEDIEAMVDNGELRYILLGGNQGSKEAITRWVESTCTAVPEFSRQPNTRVIQSGGQTDMPDGATGGRNQATNLYQCR